jgi:hypothetical protein
MDADGKRSDLPKTAAPASLFAQAAGMSPVRHFADISAG